MEARPLKQAYTRLFASGSLARIRDAALADRLFSISDDALQVPGRSVAWKLFLLPDDEPLKRATDSHASPPLVSLRTYRKRFNQLLEEKMRAPDGSYEERFVLPGSSKSPQRQASESNLETNNPLSLHQENPWKEWFASVELRKTILQDVERTFPEIAFFRDPEVQIQLTNILFLYSAVSNPSVGYRQGMHELLAALYLAVEHDSIDKPDAYPDCPGLSEMCSKTWVAADAWALFEAVMRAASRWYEWQEPNPALKQSQSHFATHVNLAAKPAEIKPYITPVVEDCNRIQSTFLRTVDPALWKSMQSAGIEPQIYGIRWLRLLFTRELDLPSAMRLWDALFASSIDLAPWICVAMLIRIRNELLPTDYSGQLSTLLRYPTMHALDGAHPSTILVRQAILLQMSPTQATGHSLLLENRNTLGISLDVPAPPPAPQRRRPPTSAHATSPSVGSAHVNPRNSIDARQTGIETMARSLLERGESLGINKTLMSAVPEIRRNLSELAASFVRSPTNPSFPMVDEPDRPPWEPRSRLEIEREMVQVHANNKRMSESLGWALDVLLQDEAASSDADRLRKSKREALEAVSYVRDVLASVRLSELEEDRLFGEEELWKRRKAAQDKNKPVTASVSPPTPASIAEPRSRPAPAAMPHAKVTHSAQPSKPSPWHHTPSNFSTSFPSASLPRVPPTSAILRPSSDIKSRELTRSPPRPTVHLDHDPLGVS